MEEIKEVGWNLAQHIIFELSERLGGANESYIAGNYPKAFNNMKAVRMRITPSLSKEQKADLTIKENQFARQYALSVSKGFGHTEKQALALSKVYILYGEYNDLVMECLKQYGYLIPPKEDKTNLNK